MVVPNGGEIREEDMDDDLNAVRTSSGGLSGGGGGGMSSIESTDDLKEQISLAATSARQAAREAAHDAKIAAKEAMNAAKGMFNAAKGIMGSFIKSSNGGAGSGSGGSVKKSAVDPSDPSPFD